MFVADPHYRPGWGYCGYVSTEAREMESVRLLVQLEPRSKAEPACCPDCGTRYRTLTCGADAHQRDDWCPRCNGRGFFRVCDQCLLKLSGGDRDG